MVVLASDIVLIAVRSTLAIVSATVEKKVEISPKSVELFDPAFVDDRDGNAVVVVLPSASVSLTIYTFKTRRGLASHNK